MSLSSETAKLHAALRRAVHPGDEDIRQMAKRRVEFRQHAATYVIVNVMLAAIWWFTSDGRGHYWPGWVHLFWGVGVAFNAWHAYGPTGGDALAREEEKLRRKYGRAP